MELENMLRAIMTPTNTCNMCSHIELIVQRYVELVRTPAELRTSQLLISIQ